MALSYAQNSSDLEARAKARQAKAAELKTMGLAPQPDVINSLLDFSKSKAAAAAAPATAGTTAAAIANPYVPADDAIPMQGADGLRGFEAVPGMDGVYKKGNSYADKASLANPAFGKKKGLSIIGSNGAAAMPELPEMLGFNAPAIQSATNNQQLKDSIAENMKILNMNPSGVSDLLRMKYAGKTLDQLQGVDIAQQQVEQRQQQLGSENINARNAQRNKVFADLLNNAQGRQQLGLEAERLRLAGLPGLPKPDEFQVVKGDDGSLQIFNKTKGEFKGATEPQDNLLPPIDTADNSPDAIATETLRRWQLARDKMAKKV